jgi:hypothetical protein
MDPGKKKKVVIVIAIVVMFTKIRHGNPYRKNIRFPLPFFARCLFLGWMKSGQPE